MGEKDIAEKILEDYNDVFADIINVLVFGGNKVVEQDDLVESGVHSQYKADDSKLHELERDTAKYWREKGVELVLYGIENQTKPDKLMPARVFAYDGASYRSQIASKRDHLLPVVTIVLYFGDKHWDETKSLKGMLNIPKELEDFVNDYKIKVFEIAWLPDETIAKFTSDFRIVADFFKKRRIDPEYIPDSLDEIHHVDEVLKLLQVFTGDERYTAILMDDGAKEVHNMCDVAERLERKGRAEGTKPLYLLVQDGSVSPDKAAAAMGISVSELEKAMTDAGFKIPSMV
ncbi:MAG: Rpn family recombination-promoting nuclease/putative transposase [Lachnospiraceae bacterium]|nr:Rpn family recombination-promoting nuclease/putative transposase [Lachnospiraceae bacterium]